MKILVDGRLISKKPTGISRYTLELVKSYSERFGAENVQVLMNENIPIEADIIYTKLKPYNFLHFFLFPFFVDFSRVGLFHSPFYSGLFFKMNKRLNVVLTIHDLMFLVVPEFFSKNRLINIFGKLYYKFMIKLSLKQTNLFVSVSETTKKDFLAYFNVESIVISEGINLNKIHNNINQSDLFSKIVSKPYFLYVGNDRPHKNLTFLLSVFQTYKGPNKLVILGHSNNKNTNDNVIYINEVNDSDLQFFYRNCSAFIFPSKYEGFGLPILEAIFNESIVFSSNAGALKEFEFKSIYFFNPFEKDELKFLIDNIESYKFDQSDLERLENYNWKNNFNLLNDYLVKHKLI